MLWIAERPLSTRPGWSRGLSAATDPRVARMAAGKRGRPSWSAGLTAEIDPRVAAGVAKRLGKKRGPYRRTDGTLLWDCPVLPVTPDRELDYAYILGIYLGDGYIATLRRSWAFRVYMDATQVEITARVRAAIERVNPFHRASQRTRQGMTIVSSFGACWLKLIPQHGPGKKHLRRIALEEWQSDVVRREPMAFLRGLIESDGCRIERLVSGKRYPAYEFTNKSADILALFCCACDLLGVHYTRPSSVDVSIARRADVALLDKFIGPKR